MTPAENALALAKISIRFSIFWAEIDEAITGRGNLIHDRAFDLWRHYFNRAAAHLKPMTVREQIEAVGWTRECGQTVRRSDGALAEYVECDPAVNQVQAWIVARCPASREVRRVA